MGKLVVVWGLGALLAGVGSGCGTTKAETKVLRAPWLAFGARGTPVNLHEAAYTCAERHIGPDMAWKTIVSAAGLTVRQKALVERESRCTQDTLGQNLRSRMSGLLKKHLMAAGHPVGKSPQGSTLNYVATFTKTVEVGQPKKRSDSKGDDTCMRHCKSSSCYSIGVEATLSVEAVFVGPKAGGLAQKTTRKVGVGAVPGQYTGSAQFIICSPSQARAYHDWKRIDWGYGARRVLGWLDGTFRYMLEPHEEKYEVVLYDDVDVSPWNKEAVGWAQAGEWDQAARAFRDAFAEVKANAPKATDAKTKEARAKLLYNQAAAEMTLGHIQEALTLATQSKAEVEISEIDALLREIKEREHDRRRAPYLFR